MFQQLQNHWDLHMINFNVFSWKLCEICIKYEYMSRNANRDFKPHQRKEELKKIAP